MNIYSVMYLLKQRNPAQEVDDMLEFERRMFKGEQFHHLVHQHQVGIPADVLQARITDEDVDRWFAQYLANGLIDVPDDRLPEQTLTVALGDVALMAKFDLVAFGDKAVIIDWKTSKKLPKREWLADKMQTIIYRYVLAKGGARLKGDAIAPETIEMRYWYADHDGETIHFGYDAAQLAADEVTLMRILDDIIAATDFPLTDETRRCAFCEYRSLCQRGTRAGSLNEWDALDYDDVDLDSIDFDIDQIAEIEF